VATVCAWQPSVRGNRLCLATVYAWQLRRTGWQAKTPPDRGQVRRASLAGELSRKGASPHELPRMSFPARRLSSAKFRPSLKEDSACEKRPSGGNVRFPGGKPLVPRILPSLFGIFRQLMQAGWQPHRDLLPNCLPFELPPLRAPFSLSYPLFGISGFQKQHCLLLGQAARQKRLGCYDGHARR
jgi:hypothetical protein